MRKTITRTITETVIKSTNVSFEKGKPVMKENANLYISGIIAEDKAVKMARKNFGQSAQVTAIESFDDVYEISVEDFMKYAKKVVSPTPEQVAEAKAETVTEA